MKVDHPMVSPLVATMTPRHSRRRKSRSVTVTPGGANSTITPSKVRIGDIAIIDDTEIVVVDDDWGDEAVLRWDGPVDLTGEAEDDAPSLDEGGSSVASVAPGEAGLDTDFDEDDGWGNEAMLNVDMDPDFELDPTQGAARFSPDTADDVSLPSATDTEEEVPLAIAKSRASAKSKAKMPDYASWDVAKLQKLCKGYGYRPSANHAALVKIAQDCWASLNQSPPSPSQPKKAKTVTAKKGKTKVVETEEAEVDLDEQFERMIKLDDDLYVRILRYEVGLMLFIRK